MSRKAVVLLVAAVCAGGAEKKPVTLDDVARIQPPDSAAGRPEWTPDGSRFAWIEDGKVVVYEVTGRAGKELLALEELEKAAADSPPPRRFDWENRRVAEKRLQWSSSGAEMLLAVKGDLFLFTPATGKWVQLTRTGERERDPKLSPDGQRVSFVRGAEIYSLEVCSKTVTRLTRDGGETIWNGKLDWVYPEELDLGTAHWWSPDSRQIAYLQFDVGRVELYHHADLLGLRAIHEPQRYPRAGTPNPEVRVGVVAAGGGATRWMELGDPREHLIARVDWLPDSSGVAVQRLNRVQNRLELLAGDAKTGAARLILRETDRHWVNVGDELRFFDQGRRLLWTSERDGFRHIYTYSAEGKQRKRLTRGEWEVTDVVGVDEQAGAVYYVSTEPSPLERHLWRVSWSGKDARRISSTPGIHTISMSPSGKHYIDTHSSLGQPARRTLHTSEGAEIAVLKEADRKEQEEYEILPTEMVEVKAEDGARLHARLIRPAGLRAGVRQPAIVMVYGGPHSQNVRNAYAGLSLDQALAHRGFVIWQLDNRGSAGRGHQWESALYRRLGEKELADQRAGVRHLISLGFVDEKRIGIHGGSYGGFLTIYALMHAPELFAAGAAAAPVTDWRLYDTIYTERYLGLPSENEEGYRSSSVVHTPERLQGKLLLIHNFQDDNVHFQHTMQMVQALEGAGKQYEMRLYPQKTHGVTGPARRHMQQAVMDFFVEHLKP